MSGARVTDPELLKLLDAPDAPPPAGARVTDPELLRQLNGDVAATAPDAAPAAPAPAPAAPAQGGIKGFLRSLAGTSDSEGATIPPPPKPVEASMPTMPYAESVGNAFKAVGQGADAGVRMLASGATMGMADKIAAGTGTLFGLTGDYGKRLKEERARDAEIEAAAPHLATGLKAAGNAAGMVAISPVAPVFGASALTRGLGLGTGLGTRTGLAAGSMGALGAGAGFVNEDDPAKKGTAAAREGSLNFGVGASGPLGGAALGSAAGVVSRNLSGRFSPAAYGVTRFTRALRDSGRGMDDVATALTEATADGSPMIAADVMGHAGRRALNVVAKQPGSGREAVVEALEQRQAGQARRLQNAVTEGFAAPQTAEATEAGLTAARNTQAAANYDAARASAGAVDVGRALEAIDRTIPQAGTSALRDDTIEATLRRVRGMLSTGREQKIDFEAVGRVRQEVQDMIAKAGARTNKGRLLGQVERELGTAMAEASPPQAAADAAYAQGSRAIEAVGQGRTAAMRGRTEDTLPAFEALAPEEQAAFRAGYADPYVARLQDTAVGTNAARPLTSDAVRTEFPAIAGPERSPLLMRRIEAEGQMFKTRNQALGGSSTAENLADRASEAGIDPGLVADAVRLNFPGLGRRALNVVSNAMTGSTEAGREATGRLLLERNPEVLRRVFSRVSEAERRRDAVAQALARGTANGGASYYRATR